MYMNMPVVQKFSEHYDMIIMIYIFMLIRKCSEIRTYNFWNEQWKLVDFSSNMILTLRQSRDFFQI